MGSGSQWKGKLPMHLHGWCWSCSTIVRTGISLRWCTSPPHPPGAKAGAPAGGNSLPPLLVWCVCALLFVTFLTVGGLEDYVGSCVPSLGGVVFPPVFPVEAYLAWEGGVPTGFSRSRHPSLGGVVKFPLGNWVSFGMPHSSLTPAPLTVMLLSLFSHTTVHL